MKSLLCLAAMFGMISLVGAGCTTSPDTETAKTNLNDDSATALSRMQQQDSSLSDFTKRAYGYAIFPSVGKGGLGIGGAYGKGELFVNGQMVGYADLSQATIGLQAGGQTYSELICFETQQAVDTFKSNNYAFDAQASAVAVKSGASTDARYSNGVAIFTMPQGGLMFEASVGGQRFTYQAK